MTEPVFIFDAHLDLSMNALEWNRDQRWPLERIRRWEQSTEKLYTAFPDDPEAAALLRWPPPPERAAWPSRGSTDGT